MVATTVVFIFLNVLGSLQPCLCWNRAGQSSFFDGVVLVRRHSALQKYILKRIQTFGEIQCAHACLSENSCVAQTYCKAHEVAKGICFLHKKGIQEEEITILVRKEKCTYHQFIDFQEAACTKKCNSRGKCDFDYSNRRYSCNCKPPYSGMFCETSPVVSLRFTTLGTQGNSGPTSTAGYANTSLDGVVTLDKGIQRWAVPFTALYSLTVAGAAGGGATHKAGGDGAVVRGVVQLVKGIQLRILIGQKGAQGTSQVGAGGGGGTFVTDSNNVLIAAAGGGGGGGAYIISHGGDNGQTSENGSVNGGANGFGGNANGTQKNNAGGGGGYKGDGMCCVFTSTCTSQTCSQAGLSYLSGGLGGIGDRNGGFGGGGAADTFFAGGGGGYSGGGVYVTQSGSRAGGGGSFLTGGLQPTHDQNDDDGYVLISIP